MSNANFWAIAAALVLGFLGSCSIVISGSSGGIPELVFVGVPMLAAAAIIFWMVVRRYPKQPPVKSSPTQDHSVWSVVRLRGPANAVTTPCNVRNSCSVHWAR